MQGRLSLPSKPDERARVIMDTIQRMDDQRAMWLFNLRIIMLHMAGFRRFDVQNAQTGQVVGHLVDEDGQYIYQNNEVLMEQQRIEGRLNSIDVRPRVTARGRTLTAIREKAAAQVIADYVTTEEDLDEAKRQFSQILSSVGSCGLSGQVLERPQVGLMSALEVVHPIEIYPFPVMGYNPWASQGIIRRRTITTEQANEVFGKRKVNEGIKSRKLRRWVESRTDPLQANPADVDEFYTDNVYGGDMLGTNKRKGRDVIEIAELWMYGPGGTVASYTVVSGDFEFEHTDFEGFEVYPSLIFERFYDDGTFYGLGHYGMRLGAHRQVETLQQKIFENVRDADRYPMLVMPQGSFKEHMAFENIGGVKILKYAPDTFGEDYRPFAVPVPNSGTLPAQVLEVAQASSRALNPLPDLMQDAPARVDSASAFQFLEQQGSQGFTKPAAAVRRAFSRLHRSLVQQATYQLQMSPQPMHVERLTLDLAGIVISEEGMVQFTNNPLPNVRRVVFGVQDRHPQSDTARKLEALDMLQRQMTDPSSAMLFMVMEGLEPAAFVDDIKNAVDMVVQNILTLYNDGEMPGGVVFAPQFARGDIQLQVLTAFMSGAVMAAASPEVKDAFLDYQEALQTVLGAVVPQGLPNPDDMAAAQAPQ